MNYIDWIVLIGFLSFVVIYGVIKTLGQKNINDYLLANKNASWYAVTLSIMATQASAITFLSTPGQAYTDGMRFVQFYLGLPIAMIIIAKTIVPIFHKLKVYTAYEYLETRFDLKNRVLGSVLFLIQRGLAAGFTILAPALIFSIILGWDLQYTIIAIGGLVIIYTASGGTEAVNKTHFLQMIIITVGMVSAFFIILNLLPSDVSFIEATTVAGKMGKLNAITFDFDLRDRYNIWTGLIGGAFLALSYFGTDQSQVQRYLTAKSVAQSKIGLLANGIVKIPMQFSILFLGALVFVFYQFVTPPLFFNTVEVKNIKNSVYAEDFKKLESEFSDLHNSKSIKIREMLEADKLNNESKVDKLAIEIKEYNKNENSIKENAKSLIKQANPKAEMNDTNYIFLNFVISFFPVGLVGLILAAIFSASMSSASAELNALASTSVVDIYKRIFKPNGTEKHYLVASKLITIFWGAYAIGFAIFANQLGSLIEAVNILGSLFYGTILGIFLVAFYFKKIGGNATFFAALISEVFVLFCFFFTEIPYLWFNVIGCVLVIIFAFILEKLFFNSQKLTI